MKTQFWVLFSGKGCLELQSRFEPILKAPFELEYHLKSNLVKASNFHPFANAVFTKIPSLIRSLMGKIRKIPMNTPWTSSSVFVTASGEPKQSSLFSSITKNGEVNLMIIRWPIYLPTYLPFYLSTNLPIYLPDPRSLSPPSIHRSTTHRAPRAAFARGHENDQPPAKPGKTPTTMILQLDGDADVKTKRHKRLSL